MDWVTHLPLRCPSQSAKPWRESSQHSSCFSQYIGWFTPTFFVYYILTSINGIKVFAGCETRTFHSCAAKVDDGETFTRVEPEGVGRFQVAMNQASLMQIDDNLDNVTHDRHRCRHIRSNPTHPLVRRLPFLQDDARCDKSALRREHSVAWRSIKRLCLSRYLYYLWHAIRSAVIAISSISMSMLAVVCQPRRSSRNFFYLNVYIIRSVMTKSI